MKLDHVMVTFDYSGEPTVKVFVSESHYGEFTLRSEGGTGSAAIDAAKIDAIKSAAHRLWREILEQRV
jgi:hypothetical protein